jgi:hypothetical protein
VLVIERCVRYADAEIAYGRFDALTET